jgi:hypothetical protein
VARIKSPNTTYNGVSASLHFVNGVAETDDKWLIEWFGNRGYAVEVDQDEKKNKKKVSSDVR